MGSPKVGSFCTLHSSPWILYTINLDFLSFHVGSFLILFRFLSFSRAYSCIRPKQNHYSMLALFCTPHLATLIWYASLPWIYARNCENNFLQKCWVRLRTIDPYDPILFLNFAHNRSLVHGAARFNSMSQKSCYSL